MISESVFDYPEGIKDLVSELREGPVAIFKNKIKVGFLQLRDNKIHVTIRG